MNSSLTARRGWVVGTLVLLGAASVAYAQLNGAAAPPPEKVMEFTQQDVQAPLLVQTLNDMGKQRWEIFQIVPTWSINNENNVTEMVPKGYQVFGRRPVAGK